MLGLTTRSNASAVDSLAIRDPRFARNVLMKAAETPTHAGSELHEREEASGLGTWLVSESSIVIDVCTSGGGGEEAGGA